MNSSDPYEDMVGCVMHMYRKLSMDYTAVTPALADELIHKMEVWLRERTQDEVKGDQGLQD